MKGGSTENFPGVTEYCNSGKPNFNVKFGIGAGGNALSKDMHFLKEEGV